MMTWQSVAAWVMDGREEVGQRMSGLVAALLPRIRERRDGAGELPHTLRLSLRNRAAGDGPRSGPAMAHAAAARAGWLADWRVWWLQVEGVEAVPRHQPRQPLHRAR